MKIVIFVMAFGGVSFVLLSLSIYMDKALGVLLKISGILLLVLSSFLQITSDYQETENVGVAAVTMLTGEDAEFLSVDKDSGLLLVKTVSSVYKVAIDKENINKVEYVFHGDEIIYESGENKIE